MARATTAHRSAWGVPLTVGIVWIIGGACALAASVLTSFVSVLVFGAILIVVGLMEIFSAFRIRKAGPFLVYMLAGILAVVVGGLFLDRPLASLASLTLVIAGYMFASGLFRGISALVERYPQWGWDVMYGVAAILLGAYVAASWPISAFWVLGTIVSAEIIVRGIALVAASWMIRDAEHVSPRAEIPAV